MNLTDDKKSNIFRRLEGKTLYDVGIEFGLDKHYTTHTAVRNKVYAIYRQVIVDPGKYAILPETVDKVVAAVSSRKVAIGTGPKLAEKVEKIKDKDVKALTMSGRDKAARLINHKLEYLEEHPKKLEQESLVNLGKIFGIMFDKAQIIQGQATEHIAVMGKIDKDMDADTALELVLKNREEINATKGK